VQCSAGDAFVQCSAGDALVQCSAVQWRVRLLNWPISLVTQYPHINIVVSDLYITGLYE
jgi:hypothetical protein